MSAIQGLQILVVEDDQSLLKIMVTILERKGATVFEAADGKQGLEQLAKHKVDLVLSDVQMPFMDGLEMLAEIRRLNPEIPVVLLVTGQAQVTEDESIALGSSGLLRKPVKSAVLFAKIEELVTTGRLARSA